VDYDLVTKYKISLYEKIYFEHAIAKESDAVSNFLKYWYNGNGIFIIRDDTIEMTCW